MTQNSRAAKAVVAFNIAASSMLLESRFDYRYSCARAYGCMHACTHTEPTHNIPLKKLIKLQHWLHPTVLRPQVALRWLLTSRWITSLKGCQSPSCHCHCGSARSGLGCSTARGARSHPRQPPVPALEMAVPLPLTGLLLSQLQRKGLCLEIPP